MVFPDEEPIIIIGSGRSGTTLARYILNSHPNIYIAEEISYHYWMALTRGNLKSRLKKYFHTFSYVWFRQNPEALLKKLPEDLSDDHFSLVYKEILQTKAQIYNRHRYGEKNPLLTVALKEIFRDFPQAKVINLVRDPRATVFSHVTMPFGSSSLFFSVLTQRIAHNQLKKYDDKILHIRLEDLIADPRQTIAKMLEYIGEPWSDRVLNHSQYTLHDDGIPFPWLKEASKGRKKKSLKWTEGLAPVWIKLTERLNREQMEKFNYIPSPLTRNIGLTEIIKALIADIPQQIYSMSRAVRMFWLMLFLKPDNTWKVQDIMHSLNPKAFNCHPEWSKELPRLAPEQIYSEPTAH